MLVSVLNVVLLPHLEVLSVVLVSRRRHHDVFGQQVGVKHLGERHSLAGQSILSIRNPYLSLL